jgi:DNA-binding MarR family transcriptional regulator
MTCVMIVTPAATAWPWDPYEIQVRGEHVGDLWAVLSKGGWGSIETVYLVEGVSRAIDKFGIERDTVSYRIDKYAEGQLQSTMRCHRLADGDEVVRWDFLSGWSGSGSLSGSSSVGIAGGRSESENESLVTSFGGRCLQDHITGRSLREGDRMGIRDIPGTGIDDTQPDVPSQPAVRTTFAGRAALVFSFDIGELDPGSPRGTMFDVTFADGLPGPVRMAVRDESEDHFRELTGFTAGAGADVAARDGARLPERHPAIAWAAFDPRSFDDRALKLAFPFAEAYAALVADPSEGMWLDARPAAALTWAHFDPGSVPSGPVRIDNRGSWWLGFRDGRDVASWVVTAHESAWTPAGHVPLPTPVYGIISVGEYEDTEVAPDLPLDVMPTADALRLAASMGIDDISPRVSYHHLPFRGSFSHVLKLTEIDGVENETGRAISFDLATGGVQGIYDAVFEVEQSSGLLAGSPPPRALQAPVAESDLPVPPAFTTGVAVGTTALLILLVKFVFVPLFTRLRRDRLLDNPMRARLFERIRAEPGIHLAELAEYLGIGKGATKHHVDQLARHRLVFVLDDAGYSRCYVAGHVPIEVARRMAVLRAGSHARVYELYAARPTLSLREAARELGLSAPSVHRAKKRLESAGLLPAAQEINVDHGA